MGNGKILNSIKAGCIYGVLALLILLPLFFIPGCEKKDSTGPGLMIAVHPDSLRFVAPEDDPPTGQTVKITSPGSWSVSSLDSLPDWLEVFPTGGASGNTDINVNVRSAKEAKLEPVTYYAKIILKCRAAINSPRTVDVTYKVLPNYPIIVVSADSLNFKAKEKGEPPEKQTFAIKNEGGGVLKWKIHENCSWLDVSPGSGSNDETITVTIDSTGLEPDTYLCVISIESNAKNDSLRPVLVSYEVLPNPPSISLNPTSLNFRSTRNKDKPAPESFTITNRGGGTLNWLITVSADWLRTSSEFGSNPSGTSTPITVYVDTTNLTIGTHEAVITVSSPDSDVVNSPQQVKIKYEQKGPHITTDSTQLHFYALQRGLSPNPKYFHINNDANGTLCWTVSESADWLHVFPLSGQGSGDVEVSITKPTDESGTWVDTIWVHSCPNDKDASNSPQMVIASYKVQGPKIQLDKDTLYFTATYGQGHPNDQSFIITNIGGGTLKWKLSADSTWLKLSPSTGSNDHLIEQPVKVEINATNLRIADNQAIITITSNDEENPSVELPVIYTIDPPPHIELSEDTLRFVATRNAPDDPPPKTFIIRNVGGDTLSWHTTVVRQGAGWSVSVDPTHDLSDSAEIKVSVSPTTLPIDVYEAQIIVGSFNADNEDTVIVIYTITPEPPYIEVDSTSLSFSAKQGDSPPPPKYFRITNTGGSVLIWYRKTQNKWLNLVPPDGSIDPGKFVQVKAEITTTDLPVNKYSDKIEIICEEAPNSPQTVDVTYKVE